LLVRQRDGRGSGQRVSVCFRLRTTSSEVHQGLLGAPPRRAHNLPVNPAHVVAVLTDAAALPQALARRCPACLGEQVAPRGSRPRGRWPDSRGASLRGLPDRILLRGKDERLSGRSREREVQVG
jgi:hypothetical protein